jgi:hypothetical protein
MDTTRDDVITTDEMSTEHDAGSEQNGKGGAKRAAKTVADQVAGAASVAAARLPEAAQTTREAVEEANRAMRAGSDGTLVAGTMFSTGLSLGLLLGGANRLLVILALLPAAAMGSAILDRSGGRRSPMQEG